MFAFFSGAGMTFGSDTFLLISWKSSKTTDQRSCISTTRYQILFMLCVKCFTVNRRIVEAQKWEESGKKKLEWIGGLDRPGKKRSCRKMWQTVRMVALAGVFLGFTVVHASRQVRSDYMQYHASKVSDGMALQLGCLEIRWVTAFLRSVWVRGDWIGWIHCKSFASLCGVGKWLKWVTFVWRLCSIVTWSLSSPFSQEVL